VEHLTANPLFRLVRHDVTFPYFEEVDQIYNLACPSAPADYMHDPVMTLKTSLIGAVNMLEVARRMGARILQASSGKVYGKAQVPSIALRCSGSSACGRALPERMPGKKCGNDGGVCGKGRSRGRHWSRRQRRRRVRDVERVWG